MKQKHLPSVQLRRFIQRPWVRAALAPLTRKQLRLFPILGVVRGYDRMRFNRDATAGLLVALFALPEGLAFALVAGLPPGHGVHGAIAGLALGAMFAGGRLVSFGPTITTAALLLSTFVQLRITPEQRADAVAILLVLVALMLAVGAWFGLALLTRYISRGVTTGFIVAAGLLVVASQIKHVLGLTLPETGIFVRDLHNVVQAGSQADWPALLVGSLTAGVYLALSLKTRGAPAAAIALVIGSAAAWFLARGGFPTVRIDALPLDLIPEEAVGLQFSWAGVIANAALAVALFSHLETSMIGRSFAARSGDHFDARQHMFGLGLASLGNALFSGMPASVSLSRSRILWRQRVSTPIAGVLAAMFCTALFAGLIPFFSYVPRAALAALVIVLATEIVSRHYLRVIFASARDDAFALVATVAAGLLFRLDVALYVGAGISIVFFLRRVGVPQLSEYGFTDEGQLAAVDRAKERPIPDISIVHVEGDLFFGAAEIFLEQARRVCEDPNLKVIVLRMKNARHLDATCALAIEELLRFARDRGRHVIVSGARREIFRVFRSSGLLELLGRENFFMEAPSNPTLSTRNALKRAQQLLGTKQANIRIYVDPAKAAATGGAASP